MLTQQTSREGTVSQTIIAPHQLYDPLLVVLKGKLRLNVNSGSVMTHF